ncbi:hypothetical protein INT48_004571 [Thamnidium elegans]|uniref:Uncharacterized protein n=1 Tax=Thamnidium elegans TaxID=101142 RepID=A0A8H7W2M5_9FUNG|nr:hypothetical protein INT48_004571 [Thamnidium elegans]
MSSNIILWDAHTWLEVNYTSNNGLPGFFLKGDYSYAHKNQAENDYKTAVCAAKNSNNIKLALWANAVIDQQFYILQNTSIKGYWSGLLKLE